MSKDLTIKTIDRLAAVDAASWDRLAEAAARSGDGAGVSATSSSSESESTGDMRDGGEFRLPSSPFVSNRFLGSCEDSGSAVAATGWQPAHVVVVDSGDRLVGAAPAYLKSHSMGEYVFDHGWADAWERAGGRYYPKLQVAVPFTPATGPRLLSSDPEIRTLLVKGMEAIVDQSGLSSAHATFLSDQDAATFEAAGWLMRFDQQFHFENRGYGSYDDFLGELASRKRKALKKERREALADGIEIKWLTGSDLREEHWDAFFAFYMDTGNRKWGRPYLTRKFFSLIGERMSRQILLVMAYRNGRPIAGALNFIGSDRLYGRNWGAIEEHPFLHFEVCYHQAIDFAIAHKLKVVEAGAQGEHKIARGYLPVITRSAHYIADKGFRRAVADYLRRERAGVLAAAEELSAASPFREE